MNEFTTFMRSVSRFWLTSASYAGAFLLGLSSGNWLGFWGGLSFLVVGLFLVILANTGLGIKLEIDYQRYLQKEKDILAKSE